MFDSTVAGDIPADAAIVAGYRDGKYAWSEADWARFPNAIKVGIVVFASTNDGDLLDCEKGNATPEECPGWITMRQAAGLAVPTIYCNYSNLQQIRTACQGLTYDLGIADPTNVPHLPDGFAFCQYDWGTQGHFDTSLCADWWPRVAAAPDPLIGALAYVCDTLGDKIKVATAELQDLEAEMARVRAQFIGPRP